MCLLTALQQLLCSGEKMSQPITVSIPAVERALRGNDCRDHSSHLQCRVALQVGLERACLIQSTFFKQLGVALWSRQSKRNGTNSNIQRTSWWTKISAQLRDGRYSIKMSTPQ